MLELVAEACVGETLGVAEARELAMRVQDEAVARVLHRVADDEQRHAQLAWRALAWMMQGAPADLRSEVRMAFERASAAAERAPVADPAVISPEHGLPSGKELGAIRRQALRDVVLPCAETIFA
jgi:rubrerythrin